MRTAHRSRRSITPRPTFAGFRFPSDVIVLAVRWYLGLPYRDLEELPAERGIQVDHITLYRWVLRFTPLLADAARPCRHRAGDRWQVDETSVRVAGQWRYVYRAIHQFGQVIDVFVSPRRDTAAARRFFERAIGTTRVTPIEVTTDRAAAYPAVLDDLLPATWHWTDRYANNRIECDHGRLKARLRPMRGLNRASVGDLTSHLNARAESGVFLASAEAAALPRRGLMLSENACGSPAGAGLPGRTGGPGSARRANPSDSRPYGVSAADAQVIPPAGPMSREPSTRLLDASARPRAARDPSQVAMTSHDRAQHEPASPVPSNGTESDGEART